MIRLLLEMSFICYQLEIKSLLPQDQRHKLTTISGLDRLYTYTTWTQQCVSRQTVYVPSHSCVFIIVREIASYSILVTNDTHVDTFIMVTLLIGYYRLSGKYRTS